MSCNIVFSHTDSMTMEMSVCWSAALAQTEISQQLYDDCNYSHL